MTTPAQCITLQDFAEMTSEEVEQVRRSAANSVSREYLDKQVRSLESLVTTSYKLAVRLAKRTTNLNELCEIWKAASDICDSFLEEAKALKESRPECGAAQLHDLALGYKNAAFKRYQQ